MSLAWSEANYRRSLPHNPGSRVGRATGTGGNTRRYGRRSTGMCARTDRHLESQREWDRVFALPDLAYESNYEAKKGRSDACLDAGTNRCGHARVCGR